MLIQSVLEFAVFVAVLCLIFNEEKVARWERKVFQRVKKAKRKTPTCDREC